MATLNDTDYSGPGWSTPAELWATAVARGKNRWTRQPEDEMTQSELLAYAEAEIERLGLADSPTNCHGVVAHTNRSGVRLSDGVGLDVTVYDRAGVDIELGEMAKWHAESDQ